MEWFKSKKEKEKSKWFHFLGGSETSINLDTCNFFELLDKQIKFHFGTLVYVSKYNSQEDASEVYNRLIKLVDD